MRITILTSCLTHGGAEKVASLWMNGFVENGHNVSCILMNDKSPISYSISSEISLYYVHANGVGLKNNLNQIRQIRTNLKILKPDFLITVLHPTSILGLVSSIGLGIKVINTEHNTFDRPDYYPFTMRDYIYKYIINKIFFRVTIFTHADIHHIGKRLKNIIYLPNPLSLIPVTEIPQKQNVILAVGRMEAWHVKGFDLLIEAWGKLCIRYPEWRLQILGGGEEVYRDMLKRLAENMGAIDSVDFLDFVDDPKMVYSKASIFVLSSRYEGFGMVLLEAMSQGCACISCDYKGRQSEIIPNKDYGITCRTDSVEDIERSIAHMIENQNYRESVRVKAVERAKDYSLEKIMNIWEQIIVE